MCLYPRLIKNKKFTENKNNGGIIPAVVDNRTLYVPLKCGKCMECRKQIAREWNVRLHEEIRNNNTGLFVTLTFSNESIKELTSKVIDWTYIEINKLINGNRENKERLIEKLYNKQHGYKMDNEIATLAMRRWLERHRKETKKSIRHWMVTELGHANTENVHIHGIVWNINKKKIEEHWKYGRVWIGEYVNEKTINYIVKYINKIDKDHPNYTCKILCSSGIGRDYLKRYDSIGNKYNGDKTNETYSTRQGYKLSLPIYYRNKLYTDEEKEKLWIIKLNKEERWINGNKIKVDKSYDNYFAALEAARGTNKKLGYGDDKKRWSKIEYENNRRDMMRNKRIRDS